jgi:hypothetical protein
MGLSRNDGYRASAGKEEGGLLAVEDFFRKVVDVPLRRILEPAENYSHGDFRSPNGKTLECKRQPIGSYNRNFIEVCERTSGTNTAHLGGFETLATVLSVSREELSDANVTQKGAKFQFGEPAAISVSISSLLQSSFWIYVNPDPRGRFVYVYRAADLLSLIRVAILGAGLELGKGNSNDDTYAVLVPNPAWRWSAAANEPWSFCGERGERQPVEELQRSLV